MAKLIKYDSNNYEGESRVNELIQSEEKLDDWTVIWGLQIAKHQTKQVGECDFLLLGPLGIMVLEVKGNTDHIFHSNGKFTWGNPEGNAPYLESHETPFKQALGNLYSIKKFLTSKKNIASLATEINFCSAAVFPFGDLIELKKQQNIQYESFQFWDSTSTNFYKFIEDNFNFAHSQRSTYEKPIKILSKQDMNYLESFLAINARSIFKKNKMNIMTLEIIRLQDEQCRLFEHPFNRICVEGGPGTGKSICAEYIANKLILEKKNILWLSFNKIFTESIIKKFEGNGFIEVQKSTKWMMDICKSNGEFVSFKDDELMAKFLESVLNLSIDNELKKYDAVIIDEAQDILTEEFYEALNFVIKGGWENGSWYIFLDSNIQAEVYDRLDNEILKKIQVQSELKLPLMINYRNSQQVIKAAAEAVGIEKPECKSSIEGEVIFFTNLKSLKNNNLKKENFLEDSVVEILESGVTNPVLLSYKNNNKFLSGINAEYIKNRTKKNYYFLPYGATENKKGTAIQFSEISAFKGMEAFDIIIYWPLKYWDSSFRPDLIYTGFSRAFNRVYVILDDYEPDSLLIE